MNDIVEVANKNIKKILQQMMLPFALHGYHTSVCILTRVTPLSLVYGMEAILPVKVQISSLRIIKDAGLDEDE